MLWIAQNGSFWKWHSKNQTWFHVKSKLQKNIQISTLCNDNNLPVNDASHYQYDSNKDARANHYDEYGKEALTQIEVRVNDKRVNITGVLDEIFTGQMRSGALTYAAILIRGQRSRPKVVFITIGVTPRGSWGWGYVKYWRRPPTASILEAISIKAGKRWVFNHLKKGKNRSNIICENSLVNGAYWKGNFSINFSLFNQNCWLSPVQTFR